MYFSCDRICPKPKSCAGGACSKNPVQKNITKANCDRGSIVEMEECVKSATVRGILAIPFVSAGIKRAFFGAFGATNT